MCMTHTCRLKTNEEIIESVFDILMRRPSGNVSEFTIKINNVDIRKCFELLLKRIFSIDIMKIASEYITLSFFKNRNNSIFMSIIPISGFIIIGEDIKRINVKSTFLLKDEAVFTIVDFIVEYDMFV